MKRRPLEALLGSPAEIGALQAALASGEVAAIPTETFYGLAADPRSVRGVGKIFAIKGRSSDKALPVLFSRPEQLASLGIEVSPPTLARYLALWPAPLTVIFAILAPLAASAGERSLAVREPAHPELRRLLDATGPLTGTSANRAGQPPLSDPDAVARELGPSIDWIIDGGRTPGRRPSTLLDGRIDPPRVVRSGEFPWPPAEGSPR
jgi:L-threonylcarbamoyladenylate synthase